MVDLRAQYEAIKSDIDQAIQEVIDNTAFINGPAVKEFGQNLGHYLQSKYVQTCANGTDALQLSLMALNLAPGDEVLVPAFTYVASAEAIVLLGLTPVFVDVEEDTYNINVSDLTQKITAKSKVIIPVHLYGQCADMDSIMKIAKDHNLFVIEDFAQALGSDYYGSKGTGKAGTIGHLGTTSFFPSKNLGCFGDGGAITTNEPDLAERCKLAGNHGQRVKYHHDVIGCNSRLDTLQAAILKVKLRHLDNYIRKRQKVAAVYTEEFKNHAHIKCPVIKHYSSHSFHQYTVQVPQRDKVKKKLAERGIPSAIYYPLPLNQQLAYKKFSKGKLEVSQMLCHHVLSLPIHTEMLEEQQTYIIDNFLAITKQVL